MVRLIALCVLLIGGPASAWAMNPIQYWRTDNGARVYFYPAHELPMVNIEVGFDAGSARDPVDKAGLAHLVNIGVREGAADMDGGAIESALDAVGAELGNENGRDMSVFELRSLSKPKILKQALTVLGKMLAAPTFPDAAIERERQRSLVSLAQQKQSPGDTVQRAFYRALFAGHAYSNHPDGTETGLKAIDRNDLVAFHKQYFVAANAVVAIVGDLSRAQAEQVARQIVGGLPRGAPAPKLSQVRELASANTVKIEFPSNQSHLLMGQPGVSRHDPDYFPLYVGNYILGGSGLISRLAVEIREKRGLAYSVYSYFVPMRQRGPFVIGLQTRNDQAQLAEQVTRETVAKFVHNGPTAEELEAAKKHITGGFPLLLDSNKKIAGNLLTIGFYDLPLDYLETYSEKIEAVTIEDVRDAFRRRLDPDRLVQVVVGG